MVFYHFIYLNGFVTGFGVAETVAPENGFWYVPNGFKIAVGEAKGLVVRSLDDVAKGLVSDVGMIVTGGVIRILAGAVWVFGKVLERKRSDPTNPAKMTARKRVTIMKGNLWPGGGGGAEEIVVGGGLLVVGGGADEELLVGG